MKLQRVLKPCVVCGALSTGPRCPAHARPQEQARQGRQRYRRGYDHTYFKNRAALLRTEGRCRVCGTTEDLVVHHRRSLSRGGTNARENLIVLCRSCHDTTHANAQVGGAVESS